MIEVEELSKLYQIGQKSSDTFRDWFSSWFSRSEAKSELWALQDVSFSVGEGETVGIIGNNGAGKSTLLKILSRITSPTSGRVKLRGRVGSLLEVGTGFHPELSGRENIFLNGSILGMSRFEILRKFDEIVSFSGIEKFLDTPVKHYSSGMYIRLAFAVAAHLEPEILIVDEVLAVGDVRFQKMCLKKMENVASTGRTVLFVSHNMSAVRSLCSKGILLSGGKVDTMGPIDEVIGNYLSSFSTRASSCFWEVGERPGNEMVRLISLEIKNQDGENANHLHISQEYAIELTYEAEEGALAVFAVTLFTDEGICAFSTLSNSETKYYGNPLEKGIYRSRCKLYPHLLNSGNYSVSITGFSGNWSDPFSADLAISFEAVDDGVLKGDYHGSYGGSVRPNLQWETLLCNG